MMSKPIPDLVFQTPTENLSHLKLLIKMSRELLTQMEMRVAAVETTAFEPPPEDSSDSEAFSA